MPRDVRTLLLLLIGLRWIGPGFGAEFAALSVPVQGQAGFTAVSSARSGIHFRNHLLPLDPVQNFNRVNGSGVAAGDFDGDGRCDLFFCGINAPCALYRNLGGWRFEEVAVERGAAVGLKPATGAVFADADGDGDLDLFVATLGDGVHFYRNDGRGYFTEATEAAGLRSQTGSMTLALGDVDGDGDLDLYVANYGAVAVLRSGGRADIERVNGEWRVKGPFANRLKYVDGRLEEVGEVDTLYLNNGTGQFSPVPWGGDFFLDADGRPKAAPPDYGLSAQIRDVNGDGWPDIYVCNDFQTPDRLWFNDGRGRFREASRLAVRKFPFSSMGVDFADLDRDGVLDFLAVEMAPRDPARRLRQVTGAQFVPNLPGRFEFRPEVTRNVLYRGNGDGSWSDLAEYAGLASTDWSWQPVFLDVDLDGYEDLIVGNGMPFDTQDRDTAERIRALGKQSPESSRTNILSYPSYATPNAAFRNRGDFTFEDRAQAWGLGVTNVSQGMALADLDGDGDLDLVINCLDGAAEVYRNESAAPRLAIELAGRTTNRQGIGAKIRVLGGPVTQSQEMISGGRYLSGDQALRTFATGTAHELTVEVTWRSGGRTTVTNARPNHRYRIAEAVFDPVPSPVAPVGQSRWFGEDTARLNHRHHEVVFDDYLRQPLLPRQLSSLGPGVAWCDLDGDGREELVIGTGRGGRLEARSFADPARPEVWVSEGVAPDDVTGFTSWVTEDGRAALLAGVSSYESGGGAGATVVLIDAPPGQRKLRVTPLPELTWPAANPGPLAAADYDGDGDLDLFEGGRVAPGAYPQASGSRMYRREGGRLVLDDESTSRLRNVGMVSGATWTDLDGDGFPELVLACEWGPVRCFRNTHGQLSPWDLPLLPTGANAPTGGLSSSSGWWNSVMSGDFDGDGRMDLVLGNWGLNGGYRAEPERPLQLYFGKLGGSDTVDLIETCFPPGFPRAMPLRSLHALSQAMPLLAERFPTHEAYGRATVDRIVTGLAAPAASVVATELSSLLLLNRTNGWIKSALPAAVQWAPIFGMAVTDVDGDDCEDLFVAQNFFATRLEWPRNDAGSGLWLRGDGRGGFRALSASESGVRILGEQRGAALGDANGDGRPDLVVTQNGAPTTLWTNAMAGSKCFVKLIGPQGNPSGVGAVVRWRFGSVWGPAREFSGGGGYWSVSAACTLGSARQAVPSAVEVRWPGGRQQLRTLSLSTAGQSADRPEPVEMKFGSAR